MSSMGYGWEGLISDDTVLNCHAGGRHEWDSGADSTAFAGSLWTGSPSKYSQAFALRDILQVRVDRKGEGPLRKGVPHFVLSSES